MTNLVSIADVKKLNPNPLCYHKYVTFKKNFRCGLCGKMAFRVPSGWHCPAGWREIEVDPSTYHIEEEK
jgi:hypothetical protein